MIPTRLPRCASQSARLPSRIQSANTNGVTFFLTVLLLSVIPLNGLALWAFVRFSPRATVPAARRFDMVTYVAVPILCALFSFWVHDRLTGQVEPRWLPLFAAMAWPAAFPVLITAAGILRNLVFARSAAH